MQFTEDLVADLIYTPEQINQQPVIINLLRMCGGIQQCYELLRSLPLAENEQQLLMILLDNPGASVDEYLQLLHIHKATFHRHQRKLFRELTKLLNSHPYLLLGQLQQAALLPRVSIADQTLAAYQRIQHLFAKGVRLINVVGDYEPLQRELVLSFANQVQNQFIDGCLCFDLTTSLHDPIASRLLSYVQLSTNPNANELLQLLQGRQILLVLLGYYAHDADAGWLRRLLDLAPRLVIVCTSAQRLKLYGEFLVPINPLPAG